MHHMSAARASVASGRFPHPSLHAVLRSRTLESGKNTPRPCSPPLVVHSVRAVITPILFPISPLSNTPPACSFPPFPVAHVCLAQTVSFSFVKQATFAWQLVGHHPDQRGPPHEVACPPSYPLLYKALTGALAELLKGSELTVGILLWGAVGFGAAWSILPLCQSRRNSNLTRGGFQGSVNSSHTCTLVGTHC